MSERSNETVYDVLVCPLCNEQVLQRQHIDQNGIHHINTSIYHTCEKNDARIREGHDTVPLTWTFDTVTKRDED